MSRLMQSAKKVKPAIYNMAKLRPALDDLVKLIIIVMLVQISVVAYVFYSFYEGRKTTVENQRAGCERSKKDRDANAEGWRAAQMARMQSVVQTQHIPLDEVEQLVLQEPQLSDPSDLVAAKQYHNIASGLEKRSRINCSEAFPKASILP